MGRKPSRSQPILSRSFQSDRTAPGAARHALDELGGRIPPELQEDVRLLVSEIVTNSVLYGRPDEAGEVELDVWATGDGVRVAVIDCGPGFDASNPPPSREHAGWGLMMVDQIADRWGVDLAGGTEVWFELHGPHDGADGHRDGAALVG